MEGGGGGGRLGRRKSWVGFNHNEMTLTAIYYASGKQKKFH
jgi:hypothetical protein